MTTSHPAFTLLRSQPIDSLQVTVEEYVHTKTGAQHIHIAADNNENVFLVALRTVPEDSTGVAHILEHTALCGSEKYPVRDPFFMMIRRSLNTFMNAFTSSDWTAYPFASQNRKDFNNLLDVYLDAVFFSRLDQLDFAQEGHRLEFEETGNTDSPLVYKGVVFNEMKGAMSSVPSQLWQTLCKYLFPTSTYHYNSGGDPECIPDLSYEELKAFYETHYHPSNATFMTFGDIPAAEHQAKFEDRALQRFDKLDRTIQVHDEKRYFSPVRVEEAYPLAEENIDNKTHVVLGWLLGKSTDLEDSLRAQLLASVLLDNSASPLQHLLETTDLGSSPSPLCGLDDSQRELTFICGIEGSDTSKAADFESQVLAVLEKVAEEGVAYEQLQASLQQLELQQREIGGDSYPYGLQLILTGLTAATHRGDVIGLLNLDPVLDKLREDIKNPDFIKSLARQWLVDNPHRVRLVMRPDQQLSERRNQAETDKLAAIKAALSDSEKTAIVDQAEALTQRQEQKDDESILPKVDLTDIPSNLHYTARESEIAINGTNLTRYAAGTNGLVYQQIIVQLPALTEEEKAVMPFYSICMTEMGVGDKDYLQTQLWQSQVAGSISAFTSIRGASDDVQAIKGNITLSAKALKSRQADLCDLMWQTFHNVRFDELGRLKELVAQTRARRETSVTGNGHSLAMAAASSGMSPSAKLSHQLTGLAGIKATKALDESLSDDKALQSFAATLQGIHNKVLASPRQYLLVGEAHNLDEYQQAITEKWQGDQDTSSENFALAPVSEQIKEAWVTNTQVNFCAKAYPSVPMDHDDAAALTVLGGFLRNGFLHRSIREQGGAYGGGASQDNNIAAFRFYSYRDPRLSETLDDFDKAIDWLINTDHEYQPLEEAILGVISAIDKPSSPAGEAKQTFHSELFERTREKREHFRNQVLKVSIDDLKRVAQTYLVGDKASVAVITNSDNQKAVSDLGLTTIQL
ncbi:insulinase family protein [Maricurvus nonylphenolicus]|uniref:insulinase family protein n=1 Tax=Maricurvus nonylphenolicus TaxID=1008307 RepID=UPI0036F2E15E